MKIKIVDSQKLKDKLWDLFSQYIRRRDLGRCITCGIIGNWKDMNAGHFAHGSSTQVWVDERNVNCQCPQCNKWKSGNLDIYAAILIRKYGPTIIEELVRKKQIVKYWSVKELLEKIEYYKQKLRELDLNGIN